MAYEFIAQSPCGCLRVRSKSIEGNELVLLDALRDGCVLAAVAGDIARLMPEKCREHASCVPARVPPVPLIEVNAPEPHAEGAAQRLTAV